jgi:hypothetical protein
VGGVSSVVAARDPVLDRVAREGDGVRCDDVVAHLGGVALFAVQFASIPTTGAPPLRVVQSLLGHSTIRMTERYAHLAPGESAGYMHLFATHAAPTASSSRAGLGPSASEIRSELRKVGPP